MPSNNQMVELKSLVMTSKDNNEIVERLKSFLERMNKEKRINWQMLACYLDGKIFEFIQANKDNEVVNKFATELVEELAEQFNLTRQI
jgi:predicted metal-dependent peptidase